MRTKSNEFSLQSKSRQLRCTPGLGVSSSELQEAFPNAQRRQPPIQDNSRHALLNLVPLPRFFSLGLWLQAPINPSETSIDPGVSGNSSTSHCDHPAPSSSCSSAKILSRPYKRGLERGGPGVFQASASGRSLGRSPAHGSAPDAQRKGTPRFSAGSRMGPQLSHLKYSNINEKNWISRHF